MINTPSRFMVIDDDKVNNILCRFIIKRVSDDAEVITFNEPEKGFEFIVNGYKDKKIETATVLFLDINMPTWSGWEFLDHFDKLDEKIKSQFKIYMLSSSLDSKDKERARNNENVIDYVIKPLSEKMISGILGIQSGLKPSI